MSRWKKETSLPGAEAEGENLRRLRIRSGILAFISWLGLSMDLNSHAMNADAFDPVRNWLGSIRSFDPAWTLLLPGIYLICRLAQTCSFRQKSTARRVLAAFFSLCMVLGFSFEQETSWDMLWGMQDGQLAKTVFVSLAWYIVSEKVLSLVFHMLEHIKIRTEAGQKPVILRGTGGFHPIRMYGRILRNHPFAASLLTLLFFLLPYIIFSYPAMFMGDTGSIIVQAFSELNTTGTDYLSPNSVIKAGVYINQHHPAFYTLLLHGFLVTGNTLFHSLNVGVFLYVLFQALLMMVAFSYAVSTLIRQNMKVEYGIAALVYVLIHPQIHNYLILVTKEGMYGACFLLMMVALFRLRFREKPGNGISVLILSALGVILLRNEGRYVVLLSGILMTITDRRNRKTILAFTAAILVVSAGIYNGLYFSLGYTPGSIREMLSVPFQQTARYVRDHPEDITGEDRAAINGVLDFEALATVYVEEIADPVKATFREESTAEDLLRYFAAWGRMLLRHPGTCLQAFCANYNQYLYPGEARILYYSYGWMENICENTNEMIQGLGKTFSLPEWGRRFRTLADSFTEAGLLNFPLLSFLMTPAVYSWSLLAALFWAAGRKIRRNPAVFAQTAPAFIIFLFLFTGPVNGYYGRYMLPLTMYLPFMLLTLPLLRTLDTETD